MFTYDLSIFLTSTAFVATNTMWAKPKPLYKQKEQEKKDKLPSILALFIFYE